MTKNYRKPTMMLDAQCHKKYLLKIQESKGHTQTMIDKVHHNNTPVKHSHMLDNASV